ncbi:hypothetical protein G7077_07250 [Sphingomonas piscis]|uniref:Cell division protein n=1 Tax=Sphingomonas piscis TaxID=2714943 RepID=A0A6G7YPQ2_9SPHN|nr:hypothetical protein [Sphingomonas piscis]QIK78720.1 hypothetical protein G7077_07250 [Sphingomonas piscis]
MINWLFVSPAQRRLLPGGRFRGPTPWVIGIMTFVMMVVTAAALVLANAAGGVAEGSRSRFVAQLPGGSSSVPAALQLLRSTPEVRNVRVVPEAQMRETLSRWLGQAAANSADLPVPALIHFDLSRPLGTTTMQARLRAAIPGASISAHEQEVRPLLRTMRALQWLALTLVALMVIATSATIVLSARGALDTNRATIEVMHGIGATDLQVTHLFQRKIALDALTGALAGALAAALTLLLVAGAGAALKGQLGGLPPLHLGDIIVLSAMPFVVAALATLVGRMAVLRSLRSNV